LGSRIEKSALDGFHYSCRSRPAAEKHHDHAAEKQAGIDREWKLAIRRNVLLAIASFHSGAACMALANKNALIVKACEARVRAHNQ
jgi:hypothetical protein